MAAEGTFEMTSLRFGLIALSATMVSGAALAADIPPRTAPAYVAPAVRPYDIVIELGAGAQYAPAYEGASKYEFTAIPFAELHYLWLPGLGTVKQERLTQGFKIGPSFRYISKRDSNDYPQLHGLANVDAAYEIGGEVGYRFGAWSVFANLRQGFGGHDGLVGEAGIDYTFKPTQITEVSIGPRLNYANASYLQTYLGVTAAESIRSGLRAYEPGGGIRSYGFEVSGRYELTDVWTLVGSLGYDRLTGDAADSPIAQVGDIDQWTAKLGVTYKFAWKIFN
jgi:outer membrane scaffolding protein for murein synthesis (MipA/OmpV family)